MSESKKSLISNIRPKLITSIIIFILVVTGTRYAGFPQAWVIQFGVFVIAGFLFFILLDLPTMKEQTKGSVIKNLIVTYILMTIPYPAVAIGLPQFDALPVEFCELPLFIHKLSYDEYIAAGKEVFTTYKCWNCHKVWEEGKSDRGPNLGTHQIGLYSSEHIKEQIINPNKRYSKGFEDVKPEDAMPDYYGEDISEDEMKALLIYLGTLKGDNNRKTD